MTMVSKSKMKKMATDSPCTKNNDSVVMLPMTDASLAVREFEELCEKLFVEGDRETVTVEDEGLANGVLTCPRCEVQLEYGEVEKSDGETFSYWRCPKDVNGVKCFVTHAADDTCTEYLELVKCQVAACYFPSGDAITDHKRGVIPFINMECYCCAPLVLLVSKSERNPNRLFFKCRKNECNFFQWADSVPRNKAWKWLRMRVGPEEKLAQARPPPDLQKPGCKRPAEATPRANLSSKKNVEGLKTSA